MGLSTSMGGSAPPVSNENAHVLLEYVRIGAPIFLLVVFIIAFIANSVVSAKRLNKNGNASGTGPGGRPLPKRSRSTMAVPKEPQVFSPATKLLFKWLSVGVLVTYVADAAINMAHTLFYRSEHWWCGQSLVVSNGSRKLIPKGSVADFSQDLCRGVILRLRDHSRVATGYKAISDFRSVCAMVGRDTD